MRHFTIFAFVLCSLGSFLSPPSYSQTPANPPATSAPQPTPVQAPAPAPEPNVALEAAAKSVAFDERKYVDPTYSNLAHLYWSLGLLDVNDAKLIDNFVAITDCEVFQTYINNDLEWREIRESTRDFLRENYRIFPTNFKITIPLYLLRYDVDGEFFEVDQEGSEILAARKIETIYNMETSTCGRGGDLAGYPQNLILHLNRPFSLPYIPVEKELARLFLDETAVKTNAARASSMMRSTRRENSVRTAYLELMFHVHSYKESVNTAGGMKAVVYAQIDFIRVYADKEKEKVLFERNMFDVDNRGRLKRLNAISKEDLMLPEGPIFGETDGVTKE